MRPRAILLAATVLLLAAPATGVAQEPDSAAVPSAADSARAPEPGGEAPVQGADSHAFLGGYAILAHDPRTGQLGVAAATGGYSAGSGLPVLVEGRGAGVVLGRHSAPARRALAAAFRDGAGVGEAVSRATTAGGRTGGIQVSALGQPCETRTFTAGDAYPWTGSVTGEVGSICYLAAGALMADSTVVRRMAASFESAEGELLDRFQAALEAAQRATGEVARSRSAALWISAPDAGSGALGRADLRLQLEDVQRPADALRYLVRAGRADHLARRASRAVDAGDHARALELADRAVETEPATALAWMARGRALLYQGQDDEAETAFQRMLEINPHLLHLLGDPSGAVRDTAGRGAPPTPAVRRDLIPYRPRLILRLDEYRRAFFRDVEFPDREPDRGSGTADTRGDQR